jgi:hypothetical protein
MRLAISHWQIPMGTLLLAVLGTLAPGGQEPAGTAGSGAAGFELLTNGSFEVLPSPDTPAGWFKAMIPANTVNLEAGMEETPGRGKVAFIKQDGVKTALCNNWAQRVETIPAGAKLRLTANVKTENVPTNTGFVIVQCWDQQKRLVAVGTSQSVTALGGTEDWKPVTFDLTVPESTQTIIVRCGLAESGKIWFDDLSLMVIAAGAPAPSGPRFRGEGFEVTAQSLAQLETVSALGEEFVTYARQRLHPGAVVRKEVFAQGGGQYQVILSLDLSVQADNQ